jgi:hypothetical protein
MNAPGSPPFAQRSVYKGSPPRPWISLRLVAADDTALELQLLADTGNPCGVIIGPQVMRQVKRTDGPDLATNFGTLQGGWVLVVMPELGLDRYLMGYASSTVAFSPLQSRSSPASQSGCSSCPR